MRALYRTHLLPVFGELRLDAIGDERVQRFKAERGEVAFYDFAEYHRLAEAAGLLDPRIELLVLLGGDAGLRRGEAIALEWTDVDLRRRTLHVQRSERRGQVTVPKGGRSRRLRHTERLAAALQAHRHLKGPRVLYADDGPPPDQQGHPGAGRPPGPHDDPAVHAPVAGAQGRRHPAPRPAAR